MLNIAMSNFEISTLIHLIVAVLVAGSVLIQWRAVHPAVTAEEGGDRVKEGIRRRWAPFVHAGSLLLILTGLYQHEAGMGAMVTPFGKLPEHPGQGEGPYQGYLNKECVTSMTH